MIRRIAATLLTAALCGCQAAGGARVSDLRPGERPPLDSDEAGLWMLADRAEREVRDSGRVVEDAATNRYTADIVCRLATAHCPGIRVDVIRAPSFNAGMQPNGHMMVWTGLILRAENEDQLAYVLGHELGHYLRRHSVQRWRTIRAATDGASFFSVLTAAAGVPALGAAGSYAALGSVLAYSRDQEREADEIGIEMMARAGYDPAEAPKIWEALMAERAAEDDSEPSIFFSTHPSNEERLESLRRRAGASTTSRSRMHDPAMHRQILARHAADWLADEERKREFGAFLVLLDRLDRAHDRPGLLAYFRGEVYRLRGDEGDLPRAAEAYRRSIAAPGGPVEAKRALGLVLWREGRHREARQAFETYLAAAPDADDRQMVESYLLQLGE